MKKVFYFIIALVVILALVMAFLPSKGSAQTVSSDYRFTSALKLGSSGAEVTALQTLLKGQNNIYPEGLVTGYFGPLTERAVRRLQKVNGLEQVGSVGSKTRALLNKIAIEGTQDYAYLVPQIETLTSASAGPNHLYVFWSSNKFTTGELYYSTFSPLVSTTPTKLISGNKSLTHAFNINNLAIGTTYYFQVKITDEFGVSATSTEKSLTTLSQ